jgi:hypothetical protein
VNKSRPSVPCSQYSGGYVASILPGDNLADGVRYIFGSVANAANVLAFANNANPLNLDPA